MGMCEIKKKRERFKDNQKTFSIVALKSDVKTTIRKVIALMNKFRRKNHVIFLWYWMEGSLQGNVRMYVRECRFYTAVVGIGRIQQL